MIRPCQTSVGTMDIVIEMEKILPVNGSEGPESPCWVQVPLGSSLPSEANPGFPRIWDYYAFFLLFTVL